MSGAPGDALYTERPLLVPSDHASVAHAQLRGSVSVEGTSAQPNAGALTRVNGNGTLTTVANGLDQPTSVEIISNTAYVVTLGGAVWKVDNIAGPPFGQGPDSVSGARAPGPPPAPRASPPVRSPALPSARPNVR